MITAVYLRDSLVNDNSHHQYAINCRRNDGELVRIMFNRSGMMPLNHYEVMIHAHSTWIESCDEKMMDPTTSDYDVQRLTLEKSEYQSRINDMLAVKYAMLFAEQELK